MSNTGGGAKRGAGSARWGAKRCWTLSTATVDSATGSKGKVGTVHNAKAIVRESASWGTEQTEISGLPEPFLWSRVYVPV